MFDHLHVQNDVKAFSGGGHGLGGGVAIVDVEPGLFGMDPRHRQVAFGSVGADHIGAQPRHRFRQQPAATADIQQAQPGKGVRLGQVAIELAGDLAGDIVQSAGVEHVQRAEFPVRIPPLGRHRLKFCNLVGIDGGLWRLHSNLRMTIDFWWSI